MTDGGWDTFLGLGSVLATFGVMFGIWWQLKCANTQRRFDALTILHGNLYGPSMLEALRFIYSKTPNELAEPVSEDELNKIEHVVNSFDLVGFKIAKGVLPRRDTLATEWRVLLRLSVKLSKFLDKETEIRCGGPYKEHLRILIAEAEEYRKRHFPEYKVEFFSRALPKGDAATSDRTLLAWKPTEGGRL